jgi:hypothetical protein
MQEDIPTRVNSPATRREILGKVGKFIIPTLVTFQLTTLRVQASTTQGVNTLDMPRLGRPDWE